MPLVIVCRSNPLDLRLSTPILLRSVISLRIAWFLCCGGLLSAEEAHAYRILPPAKASGMLSDFYAQSLLLEPR